MRINISRFGLLALVALLWLPVSLPAANSPGRPPVAGKNYAPPGLGPREPDLEIDYPGGALARSLPKGSAVVSILVDADGTAADLLVVKYTDLAFGTALLDKVKTLKFAPAKMQGTPVPARLNITYNFTPPNKTISLTVMEAAQLRSNNLQTIPPAYSSVSERKLDQDLELTRSVLPQLPPGYEADEGKPVMVFVTFYVDEEGQVRSPNIETEVPPALIAPMIKALRQWKFTPPLAKGKPVLVFTSRIVGFKPAGP